MPNRKIDMIVDHPHVKSYFITVAKSGIIGLTFNTKERWISFHSYNYDLYIFGEDNDNETDEDHAKRCLPVEINIPTPSIQTVVQDKDQITFYFIPITLLC